MKKHMLSLLILALMALPGLSFGEAMTVQQPQAISESSQLGEFKEIETGESVPILEGEFAPPRTKPSEPLPDDVQLTPKLETHSFVATAEKCGVNTFSVENECGIGAFKDLYFQCYDGYEEKEGGEGSCKSAELWEKIAEKTCLNRCGTIKPPLVVAPSPEIVEEVAPESTPVSVCYISDKLTQEYNELMLKLNMAEATGDQMAIKEIENKIYDLKKQIEESKEECRTITQEPEEDQPPTEERPYAIEPVIIDRCDDVIHMQKKLDYYKSLRDLSDAAVIEQTGFPREELGVESIVAELTENVEKAKEQCRVQGEIIILEPITTTEQIPVVVAEPVNPVVVESGEEIDEYYRAKIEKLTSVEAIDEQIQYLKTLRGEIDILIERLIKSRKEIEAKELSNVVTEIKISKGEIKADDVVVKTTTKKMLMKVGDKPISIEPTEQDVLIKDSGLEVKVEEISIKENVLRVGAAEVRLAASYVVEKLKVSPKSVELKEENEKAVYKMKVDEPRKLFGFIPLTIQKTITTDADNADILKEQRPWYAFLTTK